MSYAVSALAQADKRMDVSLCTKWLLSHHVPYMEGCVKDFAYNICYTVGRSFVALQAAHMLLIALTQNSQMHHSGHMITTLPSSFHEITEHMHDFTNQVLLFFLLKNWELQR